MRKALWWFGWAVLIVLPIVYVVQIFMLNDLPRVELWKWLIPFAAVVIIYFSRNTDDVLKHHVDHY